MVLALTGSVAACGESSSDSNEAEGTYEMKVVRATFPTEQDLGQTSLMRLAVRNTGERAVPATAITISIAGEEGQTSSLPSESATHSRIWRSPTDRSGSWRKAIPKPAGATTKRGGATTSSRKTFDFGSLKPGASVEGIWKLSAVRAGRFTVLYGVGAGLSGGATAKTDTGVAPGGSFRVRITKATPDTEVTDSGAVVELGKAKGSGK